LTLGRPLATALGEPELQPVFWLLAPATAILGSTSIFRQWLVRKKQFRAIVVGQLTTVILSVSGRVYWGVSIGPLAEGLVIVFMVANLSQLLHFVFHTRKDEVFKFRKISNKKHLLLNVASKYRSFPLYMSWSRILNTASQETAVLILGLLYGPATAGLFHLGRRTLQAPMQIVSMSIGQVYLQRSSSRKAEGKEVSHDVQLLTAILFSVGILPFAILGVIATPLFTFFFGEEWRDVGTFIQLLTPWFFTGFITQPSLQILVVLNRLREKVVWEILLTVLRTIGLIVGYAFFRSAYVSILLFSLCGFAFGILLIVMAFHYSKIADATPSSE
jgi:O-antigen/teichoic acid export membrane protein